MPTPEHKSAHLGFAAKFQYKLIRIRMSDKMIRYCGATTYNSNTSSK
jgi:hypothetical protein